VPIKYNKKVKFVIYYDNLMNTLSMLFDLIHAGAHAPTSNQFMHAGKLSKVTHLLMNCNVLTLRLQPTMRIPATFFKEEAVKTLSQFYGCDYRQGMDW
jgi:hypothetical protein